MEEMKKRKCDLCGVNQDEDNVNFRSGKWACKDCLHKEFKDMYEIIPQIHDSDETALMVEDYPYGFRLRTQIRYWVETTKQGDRFCSQTLNPKTHLWNKPKKSTYSDVMVLMKEKKTGYIHSHAWGCSYSYLKNLELFLDFVGDFQFSQAQKEKIKYGRAMYETRKYVSVSISHGSMTESDRQEQERTKQDLRKIMAYNLKKEGYGTNTEERGSIMRSD